MSPKQIQNLVESADQLHAQNKQVSAFLFYWVAWEAMQTRMFAVGMKRALNVPVRTSYKCVASSKVSSQDSYAKLWDKHFDTKLSSQLGTFGKVWRSMNKIELIRHRIVHGHSQVRTDWIQAANELLKSIFQHVDYVTNQVKLTGKLRLGSVMTLRPKFAGQGPIKKFEVPTVKSLTTRIGARDIGMWTNLTHSMLRHG